MNFPYWFRSNFLLSEKYDWKLNKDNVFSRWFDASVSQDCAQFAAQSVGLLTLWPLHCVHRGVLSSWSVWTSGWLSLGADRMRTRRRKRPHTDTLLNRFNTISVSTEVTLTSFFPLNLPPSSAFLVKLSRPFSCVDFWGKPPCSSRFWRIFLTKDYTETVPKQERMMFAASIKMV